MSGSGELRLWALGEPPGKGGGEWGATRVGSFRLLELVLGLRREEEGFSFVNSGLEGCHRIFRKGQRVLRPHTVRKHQFVQS